MSRVFRVHILALSAGSSVMIPLIESVGRGPLVWVKWHTHMKARLRRKEDRDEVQPMAFRVSFNLNLNLQSQSHWSLFNGTWQRRPQATGFRSSIEIWDWRNDAPRKEKNGLDHRYRFEIEETTLQKGKKDAPRREKRRKRTRSALEIW